MRNAGLNTVRIPLGYWMVDLKDYEPYVSGQYPYLIQAVQWAQQMGMQVFLDIHGAPGSQNGWEETGLVGPINFPANSSNAERTLNVLKNLTSEFGAPNYGGVVKNIEVLNEPIFADAELRSFYQAAAAVVGLNNATTGINVTISDAFYNPWPWKNYDPTNAGAVEPAANLTIDTHQFWAFPPFTDWNKQQILDGVCTFGQQLRANDSHIPPTIVGEWSLSTGITANDTSNTEQNQAKRTWFRTLFEAQAAAFSPYAPGQASIGWIFWAWKTEYDIDAWSYRKGLADQYIPSNISNMSTYEFPVLQSGVSMGCIDTNHSYTAPVFTSSVPPVTTGSYAATATGSAASASATKKGAADALAPEGAVKLISVLVSVVLLSVA